MKNSKKKDHLGYLKPKCRLGKKKKKKPTTTFMTLHQTNCKQHEQHNCHTQAIIISCCKVLHTACKRSKPALSSRNCVPADSETHHPFSTACKWREGSLSKEFTAVYHGIPLLTKFRKKLQNLRWKQKVLKI